MKDSSTRKISKLPGTDQPNDNTCMAWFGPVPCLCLGSPPSAALEIRKSIQQTCMLLASPKVVLESADSRRGLAYDTVELSEMLVIFGLSDRHPDKCQVEGRGSFRGLKHVSTV